MTAPRPAATPPPGPEGEPARDPVAHRDVGDASIGELIGSVTRDLSTLMRQELALAQAELKEEASKTGKAAGALGGAALAAWFVVLFLSLALWAGLATVMAAGWAAVVVAVLWAIVAAALYVTGQSRFRQVHPKPTRTVDTLSTVPDALRGTRGARHDHLP